MLGKKGEDKKSSEEDVLVKRVDAMMDPKIKEENVSQNTPDSPQPPLDIFEGQDQPQSTVTKTAPILPGKAPIDVQKADNHNPKTQAKPQPEESDAAAKPKTVPGPNPKNLDTIDKNPEIDSADTDKAVDDIIANEADEILAAEDAAAKVVDPVRGKTPKEHSKLKRILQNKRTWALISLILLVLFAIPVTRYRILGLFIKRQVQIVVVDSKTNTPVSNAQVRLSSKQAKTDANGRTKINAGLGQSKLEINKQYYKVFDKPFFVGFRTPKSSKVKLVATGRQVPITVVNKITGKPVAGAEIKVLDTTAKTDKQGKAVVVLPTSSVSDSASIAAVGYNLTKVTVQVTDKPVKQNSFEITPNGHIYFLSNLSGKIDVVKTNLDGSGRQVVFAGSGKEDAASTSLLASRDWKYAVLKSKHEGIRPTLYLIDTGSDKVTQFDSSNASFNLIGWYGHSFMYDLTSNTVSQSQAGHQTIKSYDADKQQLNQLDQNQVEGNSTSYAYQNFYNYYIINNLLLYNVQWYTYDATGNGYNLAGKNDSIRGVQPNGQNKKDYQNFSAAGIGYIQAALYGPQSVYYAVYNSNDSKTAYYEFEDLNVSTTKNIDQNDFNKTYPTYLISPSGNQTLWTDLRDGKNTLFIGDPKAKNSKQINSVGDYAPYGWYGDNYILLTKNNSQLYIMPNSASPGGKQPLKVTDYYKPATTFNGYGYGYGGL